MNVIWLMPTQAPHVPPGEAKAYDCPVYQTTSRRSEPRHGGEQASANFVCFVRLPTADVSETHWIKRSAALILSHDD